MLQKLIISKPRATNWHVDGQISPQPTHAINIRFWLGSELPHGSCSLSNLSLPVKLSSVAICVRSWRWNVWSSFHTRTWIVVPERGSVWAGTLLHRPLRYQIWSWNLWFCLQIFFLWFCFSRSGRNYIHGRSGMEKQLTFMSKGFFIVWFIGVSCLWSDLQISYIMYDLELLFIPCFFIDIDLVWVSWV